MYLRTAMFMIAISCVAAVPGMAQWESINGLHWNATVGGLKFIDEGAGNTVLLAGANGIKRSTDSGDTWIESNRGLPDPTTLRDGMYVPAFVYVQNTVFAGTTVGVFKSTDMGLSWAASFDGVPGVRFVQALAACEDSQGNRYLFAGTDSSLYRSTDMGQSWQGANSGLHSVFKVVTAVASCPNPAGGSYVYAGTKEGVWRSDDYGGSWQAMNTGIDPTDVYKDIIATPKPGGGYYLFTHNYDGVYRSEDYGETWVQKNNGLRDPSYAYSMGCSDAGNGPPVMYVGARIGVFRSTNYGEDWYLRTDGIRDKAYGYCFEFIGTTHFTGTYRGGLYRTTDSGAVWTGLNYGLPEPDYYAPILAVHEQPGGQKTLYAGTDRLGLYATDDAGRHWNHFKDTAIDYESIHAIGFTSTADGTPVLHVVNDDPALYSSTGSGAPWIRHGTVFGSAEWIGCLAYPENATYGDYLFAGIDEGIYRSSDNGQTWSLVWPGYSWHETVRSIVQYTTERGEPNILATAERAVFRSTDSGETWTMADERWDEKRWFDILKLNPHYPYGNEVYATVDRGVLRSRSDGASWVEVSAGLSFVADVYDIEVLPEGSGWANLFAATDRGVFTSSNVQVRWKPINDGFPADVLQVDDLAVDDNYLYASTRRYGVFRRAIAEINPTSVGEVPQPEAAGYTLTNYPNPVHGRTVLAFTLASQGFARLGVYNTLGERVADLGNAVYGRGPHEVTFNAAHLRPGAYCCRLEAGGKMRASHIIIVQ